MTQSAAELLTDASLLHTLRRIEIALHLRIRQIALHAVGRSSDLAHRRASAADALHILIGRIVLLLLLLRLGIELRLIWKRVAHRSPQETRLRRRPVQNLRTDLLVVAEFRSILHIENRRVKSYGER